MSAPEPGSTETHFTADRTADAPNAGGWVWYGPLAPFNPGRLPHMARHNYARELTAAVFLPFLLVVFEGSVLSVLVRVRFEGAAPDGLLNTVTAFIAVVPAMANLSSFIWVRLAHGRHKVQTLTRIMGLKILLVLAIGLAPENTFGLLLTAGAALSARICWSGILTLRSTIWRQNYPAGSRARITGRFAIVMTLLLSSLALLLGLLMDLSTQVDPATGLPRFRVTSGQTLLIAGGIGCIAGVVGLRNWRRVRVREHRQLIDSERDAQGADIPSFNPARMAAVLREDPDFDKYMVAQMLLGVGNILAISILPIVLRERFGTSYLEGLLVTTVLSMAMMPIAIPFWSRLLDAKHAAPYRAIHSWVFVAALALLVAGVATGWYWLLIVFALVRGVGFGGGALGWTLAHLDFAPRAQTTRYMGVHVTLTGLRGLICWLSGVALYEGLEAVQPGAGAWVFALCLGLVVLGALAFGWLARGMQRRGIINPDGSRIPRAVRQARLAEQAEAESEADELRPTEPVTATQ